MEEKIKTGGRPLQDKVRMSYSIDRETANFISQMPDGDRSRFVSRILKEAVKKELLQATPQES